MGFQGGLEARLDINDLWQKGERVVRGDQKSMRRVVDLLKRGAKAAEELHRLGDSCNGHTYSHYYNQFKTIRAKLLAQLEASGGSTSNTYHYYNRVLTRIVQELAGRAKRYQIGEQQVRALATNHMRGSQEQEEQDERIKEDMIELMKVFKAQANEIGRDLQRDSGVIADIGRKQDGVLSSLETENATIGEINKNTSLGLCSLLVHAVIGLVLWLVTFTFILIF